MNIMHYNLIVHKITDNIRRMAYITKLHATNNDYLSKSRKMLKVKTHVINRNLDPKNQHFSNSNEKYLCFYTTKYCFMH